ncbi:Hcp family type VI secretion system effector [Nitrososphaera viennensis]|uniref:Type VI secretion system tube protein Hcp n=2 Tax=Nitrososphaera viennensis TaxID=1034015 RepID=A0A977IDK2_9ARCH|nr:type VI secretion system tube protein Hcp [Nitrososphaera viennensis]AIC16927.1 putative type VI secretion system effector hcp1 - like protein [Nitrososphaera viennensis EN76]UVS68831.1 type VI secretion system tube protein Hcp [Nitrososphaera viennensis]
MPNLGKMQMTAVVAVAVAVVASILAGYVAVAPSFSSQKLPASEALLGMPSADAATVDYFLKIDGIEGESTNDKHKGEINVESFSWGASNTGSPSTGGGGGAGKVSFQDISFTKNIDKSSPKLMLATATGEHIKQVVLTGEVSGKKGQQFLQIKLTDVLVSSYQQGGGSGAVPTDSFSLNFAKIEFTYYPVNPDGSLGAPVTGGWDIKANRKA